MGNAGDGAGDVAGGMATQTVLIVGADDDRAMSWVGAMRSRGLLAECRPAGSLEVVLTTDPGALAVLDGIPEPADLRSIAAATAARGGAAVLVIGPIEPNVHAMVTIATGAAGYLASCSSPATVADAVAAVARGEAVLPRTVAVTLVRHLRCGGRGLDIIGRDGRRATLTGREWEVLVLLRRGMTTMQIARQLFVSPGTIRSHVASLLHKLGATDRAALVGLPPGEA